LRIDDIKDITIQFLKPLIAVIGLVGGAITIAGAIAKWSVWVFALLMIIANVLFLLIFYLYVDKSVAYRESVKREVGLLNIFARTHTTWHVFKRLNDSIHVGIELDSVVLKVNKSIVNIIGNMREVLRDLHPETSFRISVKAIVYKNVNSLDDANSESYKDEPFRLVDLPLFRDAAEGASTIETIVNGLDFDDSSNPGGQQNLRETLFYKCFIEKDIVYVKEFSNVQQTYTKKYKSGLVAPVILHGIPFALICVGAKKTDVFSDDDRDVVCTFADALSEYIRLERIFDAIQKSRKVVVMKDVSGLLEDVIKKEQIQQGDDNLDCALLEGDTVE